MGRIMIIHHKDSIWYVSHDNSKSSEFDTYEEMQRALIMCNLPDISSLRKIKSSKNHKRYVPM